MVTGFNKTMKPLTEEEKTVLPLLIEGFNLRTKENPIKSPAILKGLNKCICDRGIKCKQVTGPRLRKLCNHIRSNSLLPLIADENGYYVSKDPKVIQTQIDSLNDRAYAILNATDGLKKFLL